MYRFSEPIPWNVGRSWIMPGFKLKACWLRGKIIHEGVLCLAGWRYSLRVWKLGWSLNCGGPLPWTLPSPSTSSTLAVMKNNITIIWIWKERKKKKEKEDCK
jgi:hypothetical protein